MQFFILFVVGAVIIGAGSMLSPAWSTKQPRIGLASTFSLALIVGGAVWWAEMFGWSTLVIDYLLFALVSIVILGGTMAQAQERAEARGEELLDEEIGWPGPEDLAFFALVGLLTAIPLIILNLPLGEHAAANAMVTLAAREGGTFTSLAPFYPEISGFAPPGFHALTAYLSEQLHQPIPMIHMAVGSVVAFLCVWMAYDLGAEIRDKRLGRAMALAMIGSLGIAYLLFYSYYSQLLGILFALAFMTYALRYYRHHLLVDMIAAGLMLGAVLYVSPMLFLVALIAYYLWLIVLHLPIRRQPSKTISQWTPLSRIGLWLGVLAVCSFGVMPWAWNNWRMIDSEYYLSSLLFAEQNIGLALYTILITIIGGYGLWLLFERSSVALRQSARQHIYKLIAICFVIVFTTLFFLENTIQEDLSQADLAAMNWLSENTAEGDVILNLYNDWVSLVTGRKSLNFDIPPDYEYGEVIDSGRHSRAYLMSELQYKQNESLSLLQQWEINYILLSSSDSIEIPDYLELVFEQDGARVYRVIEE